MNFIKTIRLIFHIFLSQERKKDSKRLYHIIRENGVKEGIKKYAEVFNYKFEKINPEKIVLRPEKLHSLAEYRDYKIRNKGTIEYMNEVMDKYFENHKEEFRVKGYCYPAKYYVDFLVDYNYSDGININWRERLVCPITKLNNRLRASLHLIDLELGIKANDTIYVAEQLTPLYQHLSALFKNTIGSEYLGNNVAPGTINKQGLRHEDATNLSFSDSSINFYLTFECLEHIPDYKKAFCEALRILKTGGKLFFTVPFASEAEKHHTMAILNPDGSIQYLTKPEYHGDPVHSDKGILCYRHFGWEMFDELKRTGFRDAYALVFQSEELGYFSEQFIFVAVK